MYDAGPMSDIPLYFERLGLAEGATAPEIRRAYARELKLIDQERDGAGFQLLREAYEWALQWSGQPNEAQPPVIVAPVATPPNLGLPGKTPSQVNAHALAGAVFAGFAAQFAAMMHGPAKPDLDACCAVLARALGDPSLLNISARIHFEERIVQLLAAGWKPGHEILLVAATIAFEWRSDQRRLLEFGEEGALLSLAIEQRTMFDAQHEDEVRAQSDIVAQLRTNVQPGFRELVRATRHLDALEARFPVWLALVTDANKAALLRERVGQISGWKRKLMGERRVVATQPGANDDYTLLWIAFVVVITVLRFVF